jgi:hypothetical protein
MHFYKNLCYTVRFNYLTREYKYNSRRQKLFTFHFSGDLYQVDESTIAPHVETNLSHFMLNILPHTILQRF